MNLSSGNGRNKGIPFSQEALPETIPSNLDRCFSRIKLAPLPLGPRVCLTHILLAQVPLPPPPASKRNVPTAILLRLNDKLKQCQRSSLQIGEFPI